ncbi:DNA/RNA non-specific endonuclease [Methylobacterium isbiliense]|uniref:Serine protease n=1 Tax=Methylobacterium isbiliense TaxID=315478 RepID=A0ABQ4SKQ4_9HYPH|nr:DNA/RNA non-specific endonuclease [Methylobacterium isbiliense]MDN3627536.1 DNA/RNA non-specific endonuclease [Methylobacterium isbiliense]GJE03747.1 hypothetical protein GMJLKIPL_5704 [Methylobacterium isbiliense]
MRDFVTRQGEIRREVVPTQSKSLAAAALRARDLMPVASAPGRSAQRAEAQADRRFPMRKAFLEPKISDPNGFERVIGTSNLLSINFLDRGRRAAAAVCRIKAPADGGAWYGTGFVVGPRLLLTNNHVLSTPDEASQVEAEFGYEHDLDGVLMEPIAFNLSPHEIFYTSSELDITFVAVTPLSQEGIPLARYGRLPLLPVTGKVVHGEWVSIIQHPGGEPKQIAIQASQIMALDQADVPEVDLDTFIHYSSDTEPGSSGAPVMNDQWQVVALHHKAVPKPQDKKDDPLEFIANEGVRISAIFKHLESQRFCQAQAGRVLDRLEMSLGLAPMRRAVDSDEGLLEADRRPLPLSRWTQVSGYDPNFLSHCIDLDAIYAPALAGGLVAPLRDGLSHELAYHHFSAVIHKERKFPLVTAVNIDGARLIHPGPRKSTWRRDGRIADEYQPGGEFYEKERGSDPVQFSRGHQVRLLDPCWGDDGADIRAYAEDTFHYTNAAPQVQGYNDIDWGNLEDYVLEKAQTANKRLSVFTGPIYRPDDPLYGQDREGGPWRIPLSFWKIAVLQKTQTQIAAAAFIVGQVQYVQALYEAKVFSGLKPYTVDEMRQRGIQTTIEAVERETGLDFSAIRRFDAQGSLEVTRRTHWLRDLRDVVI